MSPTPVLSAFARRSGSLGSQKTRASARVIAKAVMRTLETEGPLPKMRWVRGVSLSFGCGGFFQVVSIWAEGSRK